MLLLLLAIDATSCNKKVIMTEMPTITPVTPIPLPTPTPIVFKSYLALGDSYTIGQSVDSVDRFPAQTAAVLKQQNINIVPLQYIATTGWTTTNLANAITSVNPKGPFDVVSLLIGVNDQFQGRNIDDYGGRFLQLLQTAVQLAGNQPSHVFVLSIPDYGVTPFGGNNPAISQQIDAYNTINRQITQSISGVHYIDITPASRLAATDRTLVAIDGLHPSAKQYKLWVDQLAPQMAAVLK
ncbi:SGNH/GDSL hydrolase family protein [Parasediminibacterium paludis]|uniref:SGNH/GDSL hydrolase family protein n=1 Tax=Parasediminibacterium paludis TaxID=908966 RepID=A0ABV8PVF6_9BACT